MEEQDNDDLALNKRSRNSVKAIECTDISGNLIKVYKSGMAASVELNISQDEILACCKGTIDSVNGYKFKYSPDGDERNDLKKLRRGYAYEPIIDEPRNEMMKTRNTRTSRGEYGSIDNAKTSSAMTAILATAHIKTRKWEKQLVKIGSMIVPKWIPNIEKPTAELQNSRPKNDTKKRRNARKQSKLKSVFPGSKGYDPFFTGVNEE